LGKVWDRGGDFRQIKRNPEFYIVMGIIQGFPQVSDAQDRREPSNLVEAGLECFISP
jgi:hypothetical protein